MLRYLTAGESHGRALVATLEGIPSHVSVSTADIAAAVKAAGGPELDKRKIHITAPIKAVGEHEATVRLRDDLTAVITLQVVAERGRA